MSISPLRRCSHASSVALILLASLFPISVSAAGVTGELKKWHRVAVTFDGPDTSEGSTTNPFFNYRLNVTFVHGATGKTYVVPGFYAADGNAGETSATSGNKWRVYFTPDEEGAWTYTASFRQGTDVSVSLDPLAGTPTSFDGASGTFTVGPTDKTGVDHRAAGMLRYVGKHHLQFAETDGYFLKNGSDTPENFLAYADFDGTYDTNCAGDGIDNSLHFYTPHVADWHPGDPVWKSAKGKGIIGAVNYLSSVGANSQYMITYNLDGGDGCDVWTWTSDTVRDRFDVSKLDQWEIVFSHMDSLGLQLHFVLAERENKSALGGGNGLNRIRKVYFRELVARFSHHLAVQWNIGEEHNIANVLRIAYAGYLRSQDPYDHPITIHTTRQDPIGFYTPGIGGQPDVVGDPNYEASSIQGDAGQYNYYAIELRNLTSAAGRKWAVYGDEQGVSGTGEDFLRQKATWGNLMGGGAGVEWYTPDDLTKEDFTLEALLRAQTKHAVDFFQTYLPFADMEPDNGLTAVADDYVYAKSGEVYVVYLPEGGSANPDLGAFTDPFEVKWYDPRNGGALKDGSVATLSGGGVQSLGLPPSDSNLDWAVLLRRQETGGPDLTVAPTSLDFGTVAVDSSQALSATLSNTGTAPLQVDNVYVVGADSLLFTLMGDPGAFTLAPGASQAVTVAFAPVTEGSFSALLRVQSDDPDQGQVDVGLGGSGEQAQPDLTVTPPSLDFGTVTVDSSQALSATLSNTGTAPLQVDNVYVVGADSLLFTLMGDPGAFTLAPGASQAVTVAFAPVTEGSFSALLRVQSDDPDQGQVDVGLGGSGEQSGGLPSPWTAQDVGGVGAAGSASFSGGVFTVAGSGADIGKKADSFHFVYQTLSGDGEIVARVLSLDNTQIKAKAGVMIRQSLTSDSKHATMAVTSDNTVSLLYRTGTGLNGSQSRKQSTTVPVWLRLVRSAGVLTGYYSQDGQNYVQVGTQPISLTNPVYVGLAVTSGNDGVLSTALFDNVTVLGGSNAAARMTSEDAGEAASVASFDGAPEAFALHQNYPNPFNPTTQIAVSLPESRHVTLMVYDVLGREVATLIDGTMAAGTHTVSWNAQAMTSGVYVYRLEAGSFAAAKAMLLMK